ncbi:hypothetical protein JB92DRAFT_3125692 [Gautieria morchelliformis]|nr:hypothetical protein JB92DRAFT_3125692 [Gautieria morchelliformis]
MSTPSTRWRPSLAAGEACPGPTMTSDLGVSLEDMRKGAQIDVGSIHPLCVTSALTRMLSMPIPILHKVSLVPHVLEECPGLNQFERVWPIKALIQQFLK